MSTGTVALVAAAIGAVLILGWANPDGNHILRQPEVHWSLSLLGMVLLVSGQAAVILALVPAMILVKYLRKPLAMRMIHARFTGNEARGQN